MLLHSGLRRPSITTLGLAATSDGWMYCLLSFLGKFMEVPQWSSRWWELGKGWRARWGWGGGWICA
jgi:hypothetical protein